MKVKMGCAICLCIRAFGLNCSSMMSYKCSACLYDDITLEIIKTALVNRRYKIV